MRSAVVLVALAALPCIAAVTLVADAAERVATAQALDQQSGMAVSLAQDVTDYLGLHRAAVAALAAQPGLLEAPADVQRARMRDLASIYPDVTAFSTFDVSGRPLARSDDLPLTTVVGAPVYEDAKRTNRPTLDVRISGLIHRPVFAFGAPVQDARGRFAGLVVEVIEPTRLADRITRSTSDQEALAYLVHTPSTCSSN